MSKNYFNKNYLEYWKKRTVENISESKVPDSKIESFFIQKMGIKKDDFVLDLGCGHGRLYPILAKFSHNIEGVDVNESAVKEASRFTYRKLKTGSAEKTGLKSNHFEHIVAWATYDVVNQKRALQEENRILKNGGLLLITGKNKDYTPTDIQAFIAERNAKLKNFPNHFTDVYGLIKNIDLFGFKILKAYGFLKRGDFGNLKYFDLLRKKRKFYEFLVILQKVDKPRKNKFEVCEKYSDTAKVLAKKNGFKNTRLFFKWHKNKYDN